jgi:hypothetical protein
MVCWELSQQKEHHLHHGLYSHQKDRKKMKGTDAAIAMVACAENM